MSSDQDPRLLAVLRHHERRAVLRAEREAIERNMYAETLRLRDIRIELNAMPPPDERMDA